MADTDKKAHSPIGASSYYRWRACPGSVKLSENLPNKSSKYAEEGTEAHDRAAKILLKQAIDPTFDVEMREAVDVYVDFVNRLSTSIKNPIVLIEHKFDLSEIYPGLYGTADCVIYDPENKKLWVIDYKHGAGLPVEVKENEQLWYYALGALLSLKLPCKEVVNTIVQPRCFHPDGPVRSEVFQPVEILSFASELSKNATRCFSENAELNSGEHCRFCPAAAVCPELNKKSLEAVQKVFSPILPYEPEALSKTLAMLPTIEGWVKSVRDFAYSEAQAGRIPPGYKLVAKRATRRWISEGDVEDFLLKTLKTKDIYSEPELKSPAQVEKLLDKENKKKLENFIISESSGDVLVEEADKRPAIIPVKEFEKIESA